MYQKIRGVALALEVLTLPVLSSATGFLSLLVPEAGPGIFVSTTYFGAVALAAGVSGPAGWGLFGLFTIWGA